MMNSEARKRVCAEHGDALIYEPGGDTMPTLYGRHYCPTCQERLFDALELPRIPGRDRRRPTVNEWTPVPHGTQPEGVELEVITPGGDTRRLVYASNLWWLPDRSMYVYFTPTFWRPA